MVWLRGRVPRLGRRTRSVLAALCLALAALSAVTAHAGPGRTAAGPPTSAVVVAARDLPAGRLVGRHDVRTVRWPSRVRPAAARGAARDVVGRRLAGPLARGEPITSTRLVGRDLTTGLPAGTVAVPVTVTGARTGDLLHPGDVVELLATPARADGTDPAAAAAPAGDASVLAARALVLAVQAAGEPPGADLVLATDRTTALRIARVATSQPLVAVGVPP